MGEPVYMFSGKDPAMQRASAEAQRTFKYFWRELSWERRRIVPGLDLAMVKLPFTDGPRTDGKPEYEHMWVGDVEFDGETVAGKLINSPNWLTSVSKDDAVRALLSNLGDWIMTVDGRAYGAFTVNVMRSGMDRAARAQHDQAWGLDFGDPAGARVEIVREKPKGFFATLFGGRAKTTPEKDGHKDHPMCLNMLNTLETQLTAEPASLRVVDDEGWTWLHRDALAGNLGVVKALVSHGADISAKTHTGRTPADLARSIGWPEIAAFLDQQKKA